MADLNINEALAWLWELNGWLETNHTAYNDDANPTRPDQLRVSNAEIQKRLIALRKVAERVAPELAAEVDKRGMTYTWQWSHVGALVTQLIGVLSENDRLQRILAPVGPSIAAARLHEVVWSAAARLWDDEHRRAALQQAATAVESQLKAKVGRYDTDAHPLFDQSFSTNAPIAGQPRLRFTRWAEGSDTWKAAHLGAKDFGRGCISAIRNVVTHETDEPDEQLALEQLAALSVLARWIDEADVMSAPS